MAARFLSLAEASELTPGISVDQWQVWVRTGKVPFTQPGGPRTKVYVSSALVEQIIADANPDRAAS